MTITDDYYPSTQPQACHKNIHAQGTHRVVSVLRLSGEDETSLRLIDGNL